MFKETVLMAIHNIRENKLRSFLTMLGIMIGVTSIIALIMIVQGVTGRVIDQFSEMGAGKVTVQAYGTPLKRGLNEYDLESITEISYVSGVSPTLSHTTTAARHADILKDVTVEGNNEVYYTHNQNIVIQGRALNFYDMSGDSNVCIIDEYLAEKLFWGENPLNQYIFLNGESYLIVGLMTAETTFFRQNNNGKAKVPYKNALNMAGEANIRSLEVYLHNAAETKLATGEIESKLSAAFNYASNSFNILNVDRILSNLESMQSMLTAMLAGIASISLLVGGVGIMNMMLVSVSERTGEIGLRKALGATPGQIQQQFIIEAVMLSLLGGLVGVLLGLLVSYVAGIFMGLSFRISSFAVCLGLGFSAAVGIVFGWMPARKASALRPIEALRTE